MSNCFVRSTITLTSLLFLIHCTLTAQNNKIYDLQIKTLQVIKNGIPFDMPVLYMGTDDLIQISFDHLGDQEINYKYTINHCESDWTVSKSIFPSDFLNAYRSEYQITEVSYSDHTTIPFTHYTFTLPDAKNELKISGNYKVTIFDDVKENPAIELYFMVSEQAINTELEITADTYVQNTKNKQQINAAINLKRLKISEPLKQIKTVFLQNQRWDNAIINPQPMHVNNNELRWIQDRNLLFAAGNEYRKFEILDTNSPTLNIENIDWDGKAYHAHLITDHVRNNYIYDKDTNGTFIIRNSSYADPDVTSDYIYVHFCLQAPFIGDDIYVCGMFTQYGDKTQYKLKYDDTNGCYRCTLLLKQGYYSYRYLIKTGNKKFTEINESCNFYQTENSYQMLIYYRDLSGRTDRLVGFNQTVFNNTPD